MSSVRALAATKHGLSRTRQYRIWRGIKRRCTALNDRHVKWYANVGYDPAWETFEGFWADMKDGYADHLTIDRINSSKGYRKDNCRWVTMAEQSRNRKSNIFLDFGGERLCVTDFAKKYKVDRRLVYQRLESGVAIENLLLPSRKKSHPARYTT